MPDADKKFEQLFSLRPNFNLDAPPLFGVIDSDGSDIWIKIWRKGGTSCAEVFLKYDEIGVRVTVNPFMDLEDDRFTYVLMTSEEVQLAQEEDNAND